MYINFVKTHEWAVCQMANCLEIKQNRRYSVDKLNFSPKLLSSRTCCYAVGKFCEHLSLVGVVVDVSRQLLQQAPLPGMHGRLQTVASFEIHRLIQCVY